jgi:ATP-dependent Clp protease ATP-binding subunit ClpC
MFERYTEKARRVIFFARYEASQFGSPYIETEHLLLGLLREDKALTNRFLRSHASVESIRKQIEAHTTIREKVSTSVDLPISNEGKRVLAYAAEEAERLNHKHIGTEHVLLGLLREEKCFAAEILKERGLKLERVREELARAPEEKETLRPSGSASASELLTDLTQAATEGQIEPVVGRDLEIAALIEILSCREKNNVLLIGERGAGKTAIVEALAQHIADGEAPPFLADKRILVFDPEFVSGAEKDRPAIQAAKNVGAREYGSEAILFVENLRGLLKPSSKSGASNWAAILRLLILEDRRQCIAAATLSDYAEFARLTPWIADSFRAIHVRPLDAEATLGVLQVRKGKLEQFHGVSCADEALEFAARSSGSYLPESSLPGKALELLDAAAARVKLRQNSLPEEVTEAQKRIRFIVHRMDSAIANHEFEKARFYSDEEKKERENLRALRERHKIDDAAAGAVSRKDVEEVIARWSEYPFVP